MLFCSDGNPLTLKEIYTTWVYSETVFYSKQLMDRKRAMNEQLSKIDEPLALMITMLYQRLH